MLNRETTGNGENIIIFVHGNSQSLHTWDAVIGQQVLNNYTKISVDLPGHGSSFRSTNPEEDYTAKGLAAHLNGFLQQYAGKKYILAGTSLGTSLISELNPFPASCRGVLLAGAMLSSQGITVKDMVQPNTSVTAAFKAESSDEEIDYLIDHFLYKADQKTKDHYKVVFKQADPNMRAFLGKSLGVPPVIDKVANLMSAKIPVAIVYGAQEKIVQADYLNRTTLPKWKDQIFRIKDAGHCIEVDQPAALANLLDEFAMDCFR
jgi:pimeloyl-ACP methyl ester carboxylesterase